MNVRTYKSRQGRERKHQEDNESGRNLKESIGKEVEVMWACEAKRGALCRKDGDESGGRGGGEERKA